MTLGTIIPLIIDASIRHPDKSTRSQFRATLEEWVESCQPTYSKYEIIQLLKQCKGTELEPFELLDSDYEHAALIARIAFSSKYQQTRLRVVSRQTLGCTGGCVLTNNLKFHFAKRTMHVGKSARPGNYWTFAPANHRLLPKKSGYQFQRLKAFATVNEEGVFISVSGLDPANLNWTDASAQLSRLNTFSRIGGAGEKFNTTGLRLDVQHGPAKGSHVNSKDTMGPEDSLIISPTNPEATIRLTAHMVKGSLLELSLGSDLVGEFKVFIKLELASDPPTSLAITPAFTTKYFPQWIDIWGADAPTLSEQEIKLLSINALPHESWINKNNLGEL